MAEKRLDFDPSTHTKIRGSDRRWRVVTIAEADAEFERRAVLAKVKKAEYYASNKAVILARNKAWREVNAGKAKALEKAWREENPERKAATTRAWYERNREAALARQKERERSLCDAVVRSRYVRYTCLQSQDVPDELVPAIRATILLKRAIKEQKRELRRIDK